MGLGWSSHGPPQVRDFALHEFKSPHIQWKTVEFSVRLHLPQTTSGEGAELLIPMEGKTFNPLWEKCINPNDDERIRFIIQRCSYLYERNEFENDVTVELHNLFDPSPGSAGGRVMNQDGPPSVEDTGTIRVVIPRGADGLVPENKRTLYVATMEADNIALYAGMEPAMMQEAVVPLPPAPPPPEAGEGQEEEEEEQAQLFPASSPLVKYILHHAAIFKPDAGDWCKYSAGKDSGNVFYQIQPGFLTRVRRFLQQTTFSKLHYTRFEGCNVQGVPAGLPVGREGASVMVIFRLDVAIVHPGNNELLHRKKHFSRE